MKKLLLFILTCFALSLTSCVKEGCTDPLARNYDADAEDDDGTCEYLYGGREFGQLDVTASIDLNNEYDVFFDGDFIGRSRFFFPNGASCGQPEAVGRIMPSGFITVRAVGNGGEVREAPILLEPQDCRVFYIEDLPIISTGGGTGGGGTGGGGTGGGGTGGGGSTTGDAIFWINADYGCGNVSVNLTGVGSGIITQFAASAPPCGTSGFANFSNLAPGTYGYSASCQGINWSGTIDINQNTCTQFLLASSGGGGSGGGGGGGSGGGGGDTGDVKFWINQDFGCGNISITVTGVGSSTINGFFPSAPDCSNNAAGGNFNNLAPGTYSFSASCGNITWSGNFNITANSCLRFQLQ